jgi:hypothetical protein
MLRHLQSYFPIQGKTANSKCATVPADPEGVNSWHAKWVAKPADETQSTTSPAFPRHLITPALRLPQRIAALNPLQWAGSK